MLVCVCVGKPIHTGGNYPLIVGSKRMASSGTTECTLTNELHVYVPWYMNVISHCLPSLTSYISISRIYLQLLFLSDLYTSISILS